LLPVIFLQEHHHTAMYDQTQRPVPTFGHTSLVDELDLDPLIIFRQRPPIKVNAVTHASLTAKANSHQSEYFGSSCRGGKPSMSLAMVDQFRSFSVVFLRVAEMLHAASTELVSLLVSLTMLLAILLVVSSFLVTVSEDFIFLRR
jgi:hypothetical protein